MHRPPLQWWIEQDALPCGEMAERLPSEDIVVSAPMSFHGSASRIWKLTEGAEERWGRVILGALAVVLIAVAWTVILCWYLLWGLFLVPYRLIRRGQRKRQLEDVRHRELLAATQHGLSLTKPPPSGVETPSR
jgi:hypothetical protein